MRHQVGFSKEKTMLKLVKNTEYAPRSPEFSKGFQEGLMRIAGITEGERSRGEWEALLLIMRWVVKDLDVKIKSLPKHQLHIVAPAIKIEEQGINHG